MWLFLQNNIFHQHNGYKIQLPIISVSCNEQHQVTLHVVTQSDKNDTLPIQCLKVTLLVMVTTCMTTLTRGKVLSWEYRSPRKRNSAGCRTMKQKAGPRSGPWPAGPRPGPQGQARPWPCGPGRGLRPRHTFRFIVRKTLTYLRRAYVSVYRYSLEVFPVSSLE